MTKQLLSLVLAGWVVTNFAGDTLAGPFTLLTDCNKMLKQMKNIGIRDLSSICTYKM